MTEVIAAITVADDVENHVKLTREIGKGPCCSFSEGVEIETGEKVMVTMYVTDKDSTAMTLRGLAAQASLQHPGCLPVRKIYTSKDAIYVTTPLMTNGDLEDACKSESFTPTKKSINIFGTAAIMAYVHSKNIIHRELKPANILLDENYEPCISDFCLAKFYDQEMTMTMAIGTPLFMAPELYSDSEEGVPAYNEKVDVYAYAVFLYRLFSTEIRLDDNPRPVRSMQQLMMRIIKGARYERSPAIPDAIWQLITRCWVKNPNDRPSFAEITKELLENPASWALPGTNLDELIEYQQRITKYQ